MYSVVVMLALSTSVDTPDCGRAMVSCCPCPVMCVSYCAPVTCTPCMPVIRHVQVMCPPPCIIVVPPKKGKEKEKEKEKKKITPDKDGKGGEEPEDTAAPATLVVTLPADATLTIDGNPTKSTSSYRVFESPAIQKGKQHTYILKATVLRDGKPVEVEEKVQVTPGERTQVNLKLPATAVAAR